MKRGTYTVLRNILCTWLQEVIPAFFEYSAWTYLNTAQRLSQHSTFIEVHLALHPATVKVLKPAETTKSATAGGGRRNDRL